ncbi:efflux RND transporter periplasmic adaptor subunit [Thermovibrio sp.]
MGEKERENKNMNVKHKAEPTRHFPRYRIPAYVEIDGKRYKLKDWSLGGCAIIGLPDEYLERKWGTGNLIFPFDTFETVIKDVKLEFLRRNPDGTVGCRFSDLLPEQVSLLQDIIEAYLQGEIVPLNDFINAIKREDLRESLQQRKKKLEQHGRLEHFRRFLAFILLLGGFLVLAFFILNALYTRVFVVKALSAFYDSNVKVIKTPLPGIFRTKHVFKPFESIKEGELIGSITAPSGAATLIYSPVNGIVLKSFLNNGDTVVQADPIISVVPNGAKVYVYANVMHQDLENITVGQSVRMKDAEGEVFYGRIKEIKAAPSIGMVHRLNRPTYSFAWNYDVVIIEPDREVPISKIGEAVQVKIELIPKEISFLFKPFRRW